MKDSINILIIETDPSLLAGLEEKINFLGFKSCRDALINTEYPSAR